jgi:AraC-like DNA-binding protein
LDVVSFVPPSLVGHLHVVVGEEHRLFIASDWGSLEELIRMEPVDIVVVDPRDGAEVRTHEVEGLLRQFPSLPVVVYTTLSPEITQSLVKLARVGLHTVVLRGFDDEALRFRALLERLPEYEMSERLLVMLRGPLGQVPATLRRAIVRCVRSPHEFQDVSDLVRASGVTRRTFDRWMGIVGVSSKSLVRIARAVRAYHLMRDPGYRLTDVARKVGYPDTRLFARHVQQVTGMVPSSLRRRLEPDEFIGLIGDRLRRLDVED